MKFNDLMAIVQLAFDDTVQKTSGQGCPVYQNLSFICTNKLNTPQLKDSKLCTNVFNGEF